VSAANALFILALAAAALSLPAAAQAPANAPPPAVTVAPVENKDIAPSREFIGRVEAVQAVDLRARVQGFLREVSFREGQDVKAGEALFVIEPDQYEAALAQAEAQLASARATLKNADLNLDRRQELRRSGNVSIADVDKATADRDSAAAAVASAEAGVQVARLSLGYTKIVSPIAGRIGRAAFTEGNLVGPDSGPLARVVQLDPIRVVYSVSERDFIAVTREESGATPAEISVGFVPRLRLADGSAYPQPGKVDFVDNEVDPATATIAVRAVFPNPKGILLPGETVNVVVRPAQGKEMPIVPMSAVQESRDGRFVLVVDAQNRVEARPIKTGAQVGQAWTVEEGLAPGETIIVDGLQKVKPGIVVQPARAPPAPKTQ
jgi:membrane fusion protein (multidrug efflux system)